MNWVICVMKRQWQQLLILKTILYVITIMSIVSAAPPPMKIVLSKPFINTGVYDVVKQQNGSLIVMGTQYSSTNSNSIAIFKVDTTGKILWNKFYGSGGYFSDGKIRQESRGGYIINSSYVNLPDFTFHPWVSRINESGMLIWTNTSLISDGALTYVAATVEATDGGSICIGGSTGSDSIASVKKPYIFKLDTLGQMIWKKYYRMSNSSEGYVECILPTMDSCFMTVVRGTERTVAASYSEDLWLLKVDKQGDSLWAKRLYEQSSQIIPRFMKKTNDNGYIIVGGKEISQKIGDTYVYADSLFIVKCDGLGKKLWRKSYCNGNSSSGYSVESTNDNGFIVTGGIHIKTCVDTLCQTIEHAWILRLNEMGDTLWTRVVEDTGNLNSYGSTVLKTGNNRFLFAYCRKSESYLADLEDLTVVKIISNPFVRQEKRFETNTFSENPLAIDLLGKKLSTFNNIKNYNSRHAFSSGIIINKNKVSKKVQKSAFIK